MRKTLFIITFLVITLLAGAPVQAQQIAGQSAVLTSLTAQQKTMSIASEDQRELRKRTIKAVLEKYNSPMAEEVDTYIHICETYELNCYLLPAISGVESGFGKHIKSGTYNAFGWGGGTLKFDNWQVGITTVGKSLRHKYIERGAVTLDSVGSIYAASPVWSDKVRKFLAEFEKEEAQQELKMANHDVQL